METFEQFKSLLLLVGLVLSWIGLIAYSAKLRRAAATAPRLVRLATQTNQSSDPRVAVIIPAYNEAETIADCITSVLQSTHLPPTQLAVWVVDDQSTDATLAIAQSLQQDLNDQRLKILVGQPRPQHQIWTGKNWACVQGVQQASGDFLLFLDADVRLKPGAIESALQTMAQEQLDLLTCWPQIICDCLAEWLVQPLMASLLTVGFDFAEVNDPKTDTAFAVGPFMLFRRTTYEQIGGHEAVASQVVEDVELARLIKRKGLKLQYALGAELAEVRMYRSWAALWEGWTKNWHLGSNRNLPLSLYSALATLLFCTAPWLGLAIVLLKSRLTDFTWVDGLTIGFALAAIALQFYVRQIVADLSGIPTRYWWLTGVGGVLVAAIALASIIKTETGWGWTWRGRTLQLPDPTGDLKT